MSRLTCTLLVALAAVAFTTVEAGRCLKDRCTLKPCLNGGECISTPRVGKGYDCICKDGFTGTYCEESEGDCDPIDPCDPSPCQNGGECAPTGSDGYGYDRYKCTCPKGFKGFDCEVVDAPPPTRAPPPETTPAVPKNPCDPNPCKNFEACSDTPSGGKKYTCTCPPKYTGCNCEIEKVTVCPRGWTYLSEGKSCYKLQTTPGSWSSHEATCKASYKGADLTKISSKSENDGILAHIKTYPTTAEKATCKENGWYVGLQRKVLKDCNSKFEWKSVTGCTGEAYTYTDWNTGEPSCGTGNESCVHLAEKFGYHWNDLVCETSACAVCELSLF